MRLSKRPFFPFALSFAFALPPGLAVELDHSWRECLSHGDSLLVEQRIFSAESCYREALKKVEKAPHTKDDLAKCLQKLGATLMLDGKIEEALSLYRRALRVLEEKYGTQSIKVVPPLFALGSIFESEGNPKIAMGYYQRALSISERKYGPNGAVVAKSLQRLARTKFNTGKPEQAEHDYKRALSILMQEPSLKSSDQMESLLADYGDLLRKTDTTNKDLISAFDMAVASSHKEANKFAQCPPTQNKTFMQPMIEPIEDEKKNAVSVFESEILRDKVSGAPTQGVPSSRWQAQMQQDQAKGMSGQSNMEQEILLRGFKEPFNGRTLAPAYGTMTNVFQGQYPYKQQEEQYERMVAIDMKTLGANHPSVADDLYGLALLYISEHRNQEAKPVLERALSIYQGAYGKDSALVTRVRATLASVMQANGSEPDSQALLSQALGQGFPALAPNNLETARILNELAFQYFRQGKLEDACTTYRWALASTEGALGEQSPLVAACLEDYASVLTALGRTDEARQMQDRANKIKSAPQALK